MSKKGVVPALKSMNAEGQEMVTFDLDALADAAIHWKQTAEYWKKIAVIGILGTIFMTVVAILLQV